MRWRGTLVLLAACAACTGPRTVVLHRSNCEVCHQPLDASGKPSGLRDAHPWYPVDCATCHGGTAWICDGTLDERSSPPRCDGTWLYDKALAHPSPGTGHTFLRNLSSAELDQVSLEYLRFINPGDFRVVAGTCGLCHDDVAAAVTRSVMTHTGGEISVARYRSGAATRPFDGASAADIGAAPELPDASCALTRTTRFDPPDARPGTSTTVASIVARAQDQYLVKSCLRCHLSDFGENRFPGDYRSSGCSACHMSYADDGRSHSSDPMLVTETAPHPVSHQLVAAPAIAQCTHCHYRGARIGISYQGMRESAGAGLNPPNATPLGRGLHGHDPLYYLTDEDNSNTTDETPPDIHYEAGMHCVDCHTATEIHGDGHLYGDLGCAISVQCSDCHGDARTRAKIENSAHALTAADGNIILTTKVSRKKLVVPQVLDAITPGHPRFSALAASAMGIWPDGRSHTDELECDTCHSDWMPNCYGCHVTVDLDRTARYQTTGREVPGAPSGSRRHVALHDLVLMRNTRGRIAPSMPAERFFLTLTGTAFPEGYRPITDAPRTFVLPDGRKLAGFGQRPVHPHTVRRRGSFSACDRCHSVGSAEAPENATLLDISFGFGSNRFLFTGCDVTNAIDTCGPNDRTTWQLDAIQTHDYEPLVVVGHDLPHVARPLTAAEIAAMRAVVIRADEAIRTLPATDASTNPFWPGPAVGTNSPPASP
ncbi:MAG: hypothetical protein D6761_10655 [Candidatus Dadabacteria bacterium]|nr:MAG: hypothetical protein D6761_10655 [Candidatus Dadabacteria bacterium]